MREQADVPSEIWLPCLEVSLEVLKARLDGALGSLSWLWGQPCPWQGLGLGGLWGPFQPKLFCDVMVKETTKCRHHTSELVGMQLVH